MKQLILLFIIILFCTCREVGVYNPGNTNSNNSEVYVSVGSKTFRVHKVILNGTTEEFIYVLAPKDTSVKVIIEDIGYKKSKSHTSVIKVE